MKSQKYSRALTSRGHEWRSVNSVTKSKPRHGTSGVTTNTSAPPSRSGWISAVDNTAFTPTQPNSTVVRMAAEFDATEFVDEDFETASRRPLPSSRPMSAPAEDPQRAPTREEVDLKVNDLHGKLAELERAKNELERQRAALEEVRRRQMEFTTGREELIRDLNRGIQLLVERETAARRDAEQMAKSLTDLRECLAKLQELQPDSWTKDTFSAELSKGLGLVDHARMEWNSARLKFPVLSGQGPADEAANPAPPAKAALPLAGRGFFEVCRLGLALTWPIAVAGLAIFLVLLIKR